MLPTMHLLYTLYPFPRLCSLIELLTIIPCSIVHPLHPPPRRHGPHSTRYYVTNQSGCLSCVLSGPSRYYADASSAYHIENVKIPLICLNAEDDPFAPWEGVPLEK